MDPTTVPVTPDLPPQDQPSTPKAGNNLGIILGVLVLVILFSLVGYSLGRVTGNKPAPVQTQTPPATESLKKDPFLDNQTALVQGEITSITDSTISIRNDRNQIREFSINPTVGVTELKTGVSQASPSANLKLLAAGKRVSLSLELINDRYEVKSILVFPYIVPITPSPKS